jgi:hypothetical protein
MSSRSVYLRDQAAKCEWHATNIRDDQTQVALRKLAAQYLAEAEDIESKESAGGQHALARSRQIKESAS